MTEHLVMVQFEKKLLGLVDDFKTNEVIAGEFGNIEGQRAFQYCCVLLEETLKNNGVHVGRLIDISPKQ